VFRIHNLTDRISYEWLDGMTNPGALKTAAAGTRTLETTEGPTVNAAGSGTAAVAQVSDPGLLVGGEHTNVQGGLQGNNVTIPATIMLASKSFAWEAVALRSTGGRSQRRPHSHMYTEPIMSDHCVSIRRLNNGFVIEATDPEIEARRTTPRKPGAYRYKSPRVEYAMKNSKEVLKWLKDNESVWATARRRVRLRVRGSRRRD
jgi:hypothetical protein